ncbi:MAG: hypothetical protein CXR31_03330 [Geobacter sp.]|nr:MAG: hypothetical protein CXR31_03330 [Geobacter sp.]
MAQQALKIHVEGYREQARHAHHGRLFGKVFIASLLLHSAVFALSMYHNQRQTSTPPRLFMVDLTLTQLHETKTVADPPPSARIVKPTLPARAQAPSLPSVVTRQESVQPAAPPVPASAIGESTGHSMPRAERNIPTRRPADGKPVATTVTPVTNVKTIDENKLAKARASYRTLIASLIDRNKEYPLFARKAGQQGTCNVRCTMMCDGTVKSVEVISSSGYGTLDKAGLRAVNNVGRFPPPPHEGTCPDVSFEVPVSFRLTER